MSDICRVITGKARSTFMFCGKLEQRGKKITENTPRTVKTCILIPKKDKRTYKKIIAAMKAALKKKNLPERYAKVSKNVGKDGCCLRDVDYEREEGTLPASMADAPANHYFLNATGYKLPGLIDEDGDPVDVSDTEQRDEMLVSGYYFKFSITFKGYSNDQDGVSAELNNLLFKGEGERLDGGVKAEDEEWGDDDDDEPKSKRGKKNKGPSIEDQIEELEEELEEAEDDGDKKEARRIKKEIRKLNK